MTQIPVIQRYRGALLGLACGDAVGTTLEFKPLGTFQPIDDMVGGGPFSLEPGQWTDDTSMALCLAESLVHCRGFDPADQMKRYVAWYREGYLSSTGRCFDIGNTVRAALHSFEETGNPYSGSAHPRSAGNGSIMRLAPVPLAYASQPLQAIKLSADSSRTTHRAEAAVDACRYFGGVIVGAVNGASKDELLSSRYSPVPDYYTDSPLVQEMDEVAAGSFKERNSSEAQTSGGVIGPEDEDTLAAWHNSSLPIQGTGYVVRSLEAALWAFYHGETFEEGCLLAVNLGDDADTTGAVYGQLAGAHYGEQGIPERWRRRLAKRKLIETLADQLFKLNQRWPSQ
jgi:ADP-ribosylglycohydrolase